MPPHGWRLRSAARYPFPEPTAPFLSGAGLLGFDALTLSLLCAVDSTRSLVSREVSAQLCLSQAGWLLSCCHSNSAELRSAAAASAAFFYLAVCHLCETLSAVVCYRRLLPFSQLISEALLKTLELMSKLRQQVKDMETSFYRMLQVFEHTQTHTHTPSDSRSHRPSAAQDQRIVTPLSLALTSPHRERVQLGLSLLLEATPLPDFPSLL